MEANEVKKALLDRAEEVCRHLLPNGKVVKNDWVCSKNDRLADGSGGHSLHIGIAGNNAGVMKDFGGEAKASNLLEVWRQVRGIDFRPALDEARKWLEQHGVKMEAPVRASFKRQYAKPDKRGITFAGNRVQTYIVMERRIPVEVMNAYKVCMSDDGAEIVFPYLSEKPPMHEAQMIKWLALARDAEGKKKIRSSKDTPKVLFGKHTAKPSDRILLISEGEFDAMSWASIGLSDTCCTSVPFGAKYEGADGKNPNDEWIELDWEFINSFEEIYLAFDEDEVGRKARASIAKRLGLERTKIISLPKVKDVQRKDGNEMLQAGEVEQMLNAFRTARTIDPDALRNAIDFKEKAFERIFSPDAKTNKGIPLPFGKYPFHFRWNEWTLFTGFNGSGKSQCLSFITTFLARQDYGCCIASLEVAGDLTVRYMLSQALGKEFPTREEAELAMNWMASRVWLYDKVGEAKLDDILSAFKYAYRRYGVRFFIIDSFFKLGFAEDDLNAQAQAAHKIANFKRDFPVHIFLVAHPRKMKSEEDQAGKFDIKGTGALTDACDNVAILHRDKKKEAELEAMAKAQDDAAKITTKRRARPDSRLQIVKQKNDHGDEPTIDLWFIRDCWQFSGHYREAGINLLENLTAPYVPPPTEVQPAEETLDEDAPF